MFPLLKYLVLEPHKGVRNAVWTLPLPSNFFNFSIRLSSFPFLCKTPRPSFALLPGFVENSALFAVGNALVRELWNSTLYGCTEFGIIVCSSAAV